MQSSLCQDLPLKWEPANVEARRIRLAWLGQPELMDLQ